LGWGQPFTDSALTLAYMGNTHMLRWLYASAAAAALIGTGLVHGFWTNRWVEDRAALTAAERLQNVPMTVGDWHATAIEVTPAPGVAGAMQRAYTNKRLGVTVNVVLVNGQPGPVATHTPEVCYGAAGYSVGQREAIRLDTEGASSQFWTADATKASATEGSRLRFYWGWSAGKGWVASDDARKEFDRFRTPVLHKLYAIRELGAFETNVRAKDEACVQFLDAFVPAMEKALFSEG
jgi:hypothetical protein